MDPNETLARIGRAATDDEMVEACSDLEGWLDNGGFAPDWEAASWAANSRWKQYRNALPMGRAWCEDDC